MAVSPSPPPPPNPPAGTTNPRSTISLVFAQGGATCVLRPNTVVRGHVDLRLIKPCYASGIRVKLRAEESAIVLGQESNGDSMRHKFQQTTIALFDTEIMVSGQNQTENELANWQEIAPGSYTFPFALKVPNVNFPPCIPSLDGFTVRYVWTAHVDGPFEPALCSDDVLCQFLPNVLAPKPMEWTYHDTVGVVVSKNSTHQLHKVPTGIAVSIKMHQQIYVPGDALSMETTFVNNGQSKIVGMDVYLRRTIKGIFPAAYGSMSNQAQAEVMAQSVECKVRPGETGQADILTTIPFMSRTHTIPTFESNFLKIYYELLCNIRVKRSVFAGGDTTYQCSIPIPIATHNIDNPIIPGRTPRWTKSRLQPYFFEPGWADPVGDLPGPLAADSVSTSDAPSGSTTFQTGSSTSLSSASAMAVTSPNAMQEFLNSGSVELHRERTLKKGLARSKSLKDIQSSRMNGAAWRAEREPVNRDLGLTQLNRSTTDVSQSNGSSAPTKRSPPLGPRSRPSGDDTKRSDEKMGGSSTTANSGTYENYAHVGYTPPPPTTARPQRSQPREQPSALTAEQQVELARKASRRILPNQGSYTNEGTLPPELENPNLPTSPVIVPGGSTAATTTASPSTKVPPKRNASLSQKGHQDQDSYYDMSPSTRARLGQTQNSTPSGQTHDRIERPERPDRSERNERNERYERNDRHERHERGQDLGTFAPYPSTSTPERVPYQHSLPAHQQPPGVIAMSPPLTAASGATSPTSGSATLATEQGHGRRDVLTTAGSLSNLSATAGDFMPAPPFNKTVPSNTKDSSDSGSNHAVSSSHHPRSASATLMRIPPWERVETIQHQSWFRPGAHQSNALQTFDVPSVSMSSLQAAPIVKKTFQGNLEPVRTMEVESQLR